MANLKINSGLINRLKKRLEDDYGEKTTNKDVENAIEEWLRGYLEETLY